MKLIFRFPMTGEVHELDTDGWAHPENAFRHEGRFIAAHWGHYSSMTFQVVEWTENDEIEKLIETAKSRYSLFNMAGEHNELRMDRDEPVDQGAYRAMVQCAQLVPELVKALEGRKR